MRTIPQDHSFAGTRLSSHQISKGRRWTGRTLSLVAVLFLLFDSVGKLLQVQPVIDGTIQLGYPRDIVFSLGVILLSCLAVYLIPRTSVLGALLLTAISAALSPRTRAWRTRCSPTCCFPPTLRRSCGAA